MMRLLLIIAFLGYLTACSSTGKKDEKDVQEQLRETEKTLYTNAQKSLNSSQWAVAISNLQLLEENFPFGNYAEQAQLELIYAYYRSNQPDSAVAAADRFIRLHPQHPQVDYAYYLRGLSTFPDGDNPFQWLVKTDTSKRDMGLARESFAHFSQLMARFPSSRYSPDAQKRMMFLRNMLARSEIHVANYYFKRGAYLAAVNRGRYVVENFQETAAVPDGLAVMVQGYQLLGMDKLANENLVVLRDNYPEYPALRNNGQDFDYAQGLKEGERTWVTYATLGLFKKEKAPRFDTRELYDTAEMEEQQRESNAGI